ncbi:hypothetical protein C8R43DRAFT_1112842 [Mycena crocata]|nr:hypothetical protein C8R43DRAFT_1112842 [Mycena crocata]
MVSIPSELITAIVDELEHDRDSLKACSVVTVAFCAASQHHLFRSMWLHRENSHFYTDTGQFLHSGTTIPSGTIKKAFSILSESPHLAAYVQDLTIDLPESADEDKPLAHILQVATNLERFVVSGLSLPWGSLPAPLASTILEVFTRPMVRRLHLHNVQEVPESAVWHMMSSKTVLSIHTVVVPDGEDSKHYPSSQLEHLILTASLPAIYELVLSPRAPKFTRITHLTVRIDSGTSVFTDRLLSSLADTLTHLDLNCGVLSFPLTLPNLPRLRSVTLRILTGLVRSHPDGLAETLLGLPRVALTLIYGVQIRARETNWAVDGPIIGLTADDITCKLQFIGPDARTSRPAIRGLAFAAFCRGMDAALPGFDIAYERIDEQLPYLEQLP